MKIPAVGFIEKKNLLNALNKNLMHLQYSKQNRSVIETQNDLWDGHATILRNDEKVSINKKDLRKIDLMEETNGSASRGY